MYVEYSVYIVFVCNINRKYKMYHILNFLCIHLALSKSIILSDYSTSDSAFEKGLINVWPTLATFKKRWVKVFLQRSFSVLPLTLDKRFCAGWDCFFKNTHESLLNDPLQAAFI